MKNTLQKLNNHLPVTIVALGDSITEPTWHTAGRLNWVGLLHEALFYKHGTNLVTMINAGRCGDTATDALSRLERDVLRFQPDLVVISFGMNDAMSGPAGVATYTNAIRAAVTEIRQKCGSDILLRTSNPIVVPNQLGLRPDQIPGRQWPGMHQGLYARALVETAQQLDCVVVDHYTLWVEAENRETGLPQPANHLWMRMSDAAHPGPLGHLCFYRELAPFFELPEFFPWEL